MNPSDDFPEEQKREEETKEEENDNVTKKEKEKENENAPLSKFEVIELFSSKKRNNSTKYKIFFTVAIILLISFISILLLYFINIKVNKEEIPQLSNYENQKLENNLQFSENSTNLTDLNELTDLTDLTGLTNFTNFTDLNKKVEIVDLGTIKLRDTDKKKSENN